MTRRRPSALQPLTAYRWFIEYGGRFATGWVNDPGPTKDAGSVAPGAMREVCLLSNSFRSVS